MSISRRPITALSLLVCAVAVTVAAHAAQRPVTDRSWRQIVTPDLVVAGNAPTGEMKRMLSELYALQTVGQFPDLDALRVRLIDRPDLLAAAQRLQFVGRHTPDRPEYLRRVLNWFDGQRMEIEKKAIKDQLAVGGDEEREKELLRQVMARTAATGR